MKNGFGFTIAGGIGSTSYVGSKQVNHRQKHGSFSWKKKLNHFANYFLSVIIAVLVYMFWNKNSSVRSLQSTL